MQKKKNKIENQLARVEQKWTKNEKNNNKIRLIDSRGNACTIKKKDF